MRSITAGALIAAMILSLPPHSQRNAATRASGKGVIESQRSRPALTAYPITKMAANDTVPREHSHAIGVVLVHGILSSSRTWDYLVELLSKDPVLQQSYRFERFEYRSPFVLFNPLRRIPTIKDAASQLAIWLDVNCRDVPRLVLVGHSQGGLIIQQFLSTMLQDGGRGHELKRIRAVVLLATPNTGSELFLSLRRWWSDHPQEKQLRPYDEAIEEARRVVFERCVLAPVPSERCYPIRFFVYAAASDGIVPARSAQWMFPEAGTLPGDHFSILRPPDERDIRYKVVLSALRWARHSFPADGLLIKTEALDWTRQDEIDAVLTIMSDRFLPGQAVRPNDLRRWLEQYQEHWQLRLSVLVAKVNGKICGFIQFHEGPSLVIVDYIATERNNPLSESLTQRMVAQLRERSSTLYASIVFEVEDPSAATRPGEAAARIVLFERFGARVIGGVDYLAPNMETMAAGDETPYLLMYARAGRAPDFLTQAQVQEFFTQLYTVWYKNWFSHYPNAHEHADYLNSLLAKIEKSIPASCPLLPWRQGQQS
jgi:pimeloyl-ACP methyl ester carboxylesterase